MMSLTFGLFTQVSGSGPLGPLVFFNLRYHGNKNKTLRKKVIEKQFKYL